MNDSPPGVTITLTETYKQVQATDDKVDKLATAVGDMVAINSRLDQHHDRLNDHGSRIVTVETQQAIQAAYKTAGRIVPLADISGNELEKMYLVKRTEQKR